MGVKRRADKIKGIIKALPAKVNQLSQGFSVAIAMAFNLKAEPKTMKEIVNYSCETLGIKHPRTVLTQFAIKIYAARTYGKYLKKQKAKGTKISPEEKKVVAQKILLLCEVCANIDVAQMKRIKYEMTAGSGDFLQVLDEVSELVVAAIQKNKPETFCTIIKENG